MGEALITRRNGVQKNNITIDGEKVETDISLKKIDNIITGELTRCPYATKGAAAVVDNEKIHIIGGEGLKYHYSWDGSSWTKHSDIAYALTYCSAAFFKGSIYILGNTNKGQQYIFPKDNPGGYFTINNGQCGNLITINDVLYCACGYGIGKITKLNGSITWITKDTSSNKYYKVGSMNNELYVITQTIGDKNIVINNYNGSSLNSVSAISTNSGYTLSGSTVLSYNNEIHIYGSTNADDEGYHFWWDGSYFRKEDLPFGCDGIGCVKMDDGVHFLQGERDGTICDNHTLLFDNDSIYIQTS